MSRRQGKGDYYGGSTVISSDLGFTKLAPDLGYKPKQSGPNTNRLAAAAKARRENAQRKAVIRKKQGIGVFVFTRRKRKKRKKRSDNA